MGSVVDVHLSQRHVTGFLAFSSNDSNLRHDLMILVPEMAAGRQWDASSAPYAAGIVPNAAHSDVTEELCRRKDAVVGDNAPADELSGMTITKVDQSCWRFLVTRSDGWPFFGDNSRRLIHPN
jgi:hypothetical protein